MHPDSAQYHRPPLAYGLTPARSALRQAVTAATGLSEPQAVAAMLALARQSADATRQAHQIAHRLASDLRARHNDPGRAGLVQSLLQEYSLSSREGVALMCLAEALLRIPDSATRDALIRDKIANGDWRQHVGHSPSLMVNAATWGLLLTGRLVSTHSEKGLLATLGQLISKGGEPLIRKGVDVAMRMMGEQFVCGEAIDQALEHARRQEVRGFRYSYDMLGEAALTEADAQRYLRDYERAIDAIGQSANGAGLFDGPGISIKLSALHPRYSRAQYTRVMDELYPRVLSLAVRARSVDIGLNIDAEEADRLELSMDLLERLCFAPELAGWHGIGFVVQAYQKRCPFVIDELADLARRSGHRLMIRLVKGAYWDTEIKRAQVDGLSNYPVYTRKAHTDVSYLGCARKLLAAPDAFYPQFATHNAHTVAAIYQMADPARYVTGQYEFQCLHGMGEPLYERVVGSVATGGLERPCRIYAPVGTHETLLAYLVRRLLENGANTSFVNRIADPSISVDRLIEDPVATVEQAAAREGEIGLMHPAIPLPAALYGPTRANSCGLDLTNDTALRLIDSGMAVAATTDWSTTGWLASPPENAAPALPCRASFAAREVEIRNPADLRDLVGRVREASSEDVASALAAAQDAAEAWGMTSVAVRAEALERAGQLIEADMGLLIGLLVREAGKTVPNAVAEVREAVDFLRFYAMQIRQDFDVRTHRPLGPVVCISPWNFPLAIFIGQVSAALAAGNTVLAKPAEQTPLVAAHAVRRLREAGIPSAALQLVPGRGDTVGAALVADHRIQGVLFTGSTQVARLIQRSLATRSGIAGQPIPLIAETGGQNAMVVDSSALAEQVVMDVMTSAFESAGQRCSALRLLCLQNEVADRIIDMLQGAMAERRIGNPAELAVDIGPVIDAEARDGIERHVRDMQERSLRVHQAVGHQHEPAITPGTYVLPTLIELNDVSALQREVFGPVLHVVRYDRARLGELMAQINATGYGLTFGVHTRIDETIAQVIGAAQAGNVYVNRNMVGAVVGVQPFGGEGLSGTGPKAGGPLYLYRLLSVQHDDVLHRIDRVVHAQATPPVVPDSTPGRPLDVLRSWANQQGRSALATYCDTADSAARVGWTWDLMGPTGERNTYTLHPRSRVLCVADDDDVLLEQLAAVLAVGSHAVVHRQMTETIAQLPKALLNCITMCADITVNTTQLDAALHAGSVQSLQALVQTLATREGPIVPVTSMVCGHVPMDRLVVERSISVNTAAAGGNASLMTLG